LLIPLRLHRILTPSKIDSQITRFGFEDGNIFVC
jgi:hypothetical protein